MHIGLFAPYDLARPGGVATHIRAQARALRARGHTVQVCGPASVPLPDGEVRLGRSLPVSFDGTRSGAGLDPRAIRLVRREMASQPFDVVHVHEPLMPLAPWAAVWFARAPVVATFHVHREAGHALYPLARPLLARIIERIDCRLAVSPAARRTVSAHFPGFYQIVPNGIDVERFERRMPRPAALAEGRRHVLFVGRLEPRKGVAHLIAAMKEVQDRRPGARLTIAGDGPERSALERLARSMAIDAVFLGDVGDADLPALYQWSDVACSPAIGGESFGIVLLEALAAGTPVIATRIEGYEYVVGGAECGALVPPGDVDALAVAIAHLLADDEARHTASRQGVELAREYDWRVIARRLETIYQAVRDSRRDPARPGTTSHRPTRAAAALPANQTALDHQSRTACE